MIYLKTCKFSAIFVEKKCKELLHCNSSSVSLRKKYQHTWVYVCFAIDKNNAYKPFHKIKETWSNFDQSNIDSENNETHYRTWELTQFCLPMTFFEWHPYLHANTMPWLTTVISINVTFEDKEHIWTKIWISALPWVCVTVMSFAGCICLLIPASAVLDFQSYNWLI